MFLKRAVELQIRSNNINLVKYEGSLDLILTFLRSREGTTVLQTGVLETLEIIYTTSMVGRGRKPSKGTISDYQT